MLAGPPSSNSQLRPHLALKTATPNPRLAPFSTSCLSAQPQTFPLHTPNSASEPTSCPEPTFPIPPKSPQTPGQCSDPNFLYSPCGSPKPSTTQSGFLAEIRD